MTHKILCKNGLKILKDGCGIIFSRISQRELRNEIQNSITFLIMYAVMHTNEMSPALLHKKKSLDSYFYQVHESRSKMRCVS